MKTDSSVWLSKRFSVVLLYLLALSVYFFVIWANPMPLVSVAMGNNHPIILLSVFVIFFFIFRLSEKKSFALGLTLTLLLCSFSLHYIWNTSLSDNKIIGGLIPYKDSQGYFFAADLLLNGAKIPTYSLSAARPFYSSFLAFFLFLTNSNLQAAHILITALIGTTIFLSAQKIKESYGAISATLFITLLIYYVKSFLGYAMTETAGLIFGCLAMILLFTSAQQKNKTALMVGLVMLAVALFIRPGAFFVLPLIVVWVAWAFRKNLKISYKMAGFAVMVLITTHVIFNQITTARIVEPGAVAFGNFSYSLYGQVRGGTGWHSAIRDLGTTDPYVVLENTADFFIKHPLSFFIASAKAYRDFLFMNNGLFGELFNNPIVANLEVVLRWALLGLTIYGLLALYKTQSSLSLLVIFIFAGVLLSVPFVPPIDGGSRFYAATIPILFSIPAIGLGYLLKENEKSLNNNFSSASVISVLFLPAIIVLFPIFLITNQSTPILPEVPQCKTGQEIYIAKIHQGTYIDISSNTSCTSTPLVCMKDFINNGVDKKTDDFFQTILKQTDELEENIRIVPIYNRNDENFYYLVGAPEDITHNRSGDWITGCAVEVRTKNQRIYQVAP